MHRRMFRALPALAAIVALLPLSAAFAAAPQDGPHGVWDGAFEAQGQSLDIVVTLRQANGAWSGTIDIPAQGMSAFPLGDVAHAAGTVTFTLPGIPGDPVFLGSWDAANETITGDLEQGGQAFPFHLSRRGDAPAIEVASIDATTAEKAVGSWAGTLSTPAGELRLIFNLEYSDSQLIGTMDSPDQGQTGLPISAVSFDGDTLRIDLDYAGAYFEGALATDGTSVAGNWNQGGAALPLTVTRQ